MILESLEIRNWRVLGNVSVQELPPGITVIHAPNKTGKTSMVEALRWALIDFDYNTSRADRVVPWGTNLVPELTVVFDVKGQRYLVTKRFTKKRGGGAELYKMQRDGERGQLVARDKGVTAGTRELIGVERSSRGLAQLLWVEQGLVDLPEIDEDIDRALRPMLGSVIGAQDMGFRQALWRGMQQWFTNEGNATQAKHRKSSRLKELEELIIQQKQDVTGINLKFENIEELLLGVEQKGQEIAKADGLVAAASAEVKTLTKADKELAGKRSEARESLRAFEAAKQELEESIKQLGKCREHEKAVRELTGQLEDMEKELSPRAKAKKSAIEALNKAVQARKEAEKNLEEVQSRRVGVAAMRELVEMEDERQNAAKGMARADTIEENIKHAETRRSELDVPDKKQLKSTGEQLNRLVEVEAYLKAAELSLIVNASNDGRVTLEVDRQTEASVAVRPGDTLERSVRKRVRVEVREFGSVEVVRGPEDSSVEELASELDRIESKLLGLLSRWGLEDVERSEVVPELSRRTAESETLRTRVKEWREELSEIAPEGKVVLQRGVQTLDRRQTKLLKTREELKDWEPSHASLQEAESEFRGDEQGQTDALRDARRKESAARTQVEEVDRKARSAEAEVQEVKTEIAKAEALRDGHREEYGPEDGLAKAVAAQQQELAKKKEDAERHRLSEDEERVPEQLESAKEALRKRKERVSNLREQLADLNGQIKASEGLHAQRVAAEQALASARREYERLSVDIDAHRMLLEFFDQVRDENVEKSIKPVSELVTGWLTELDGPTHHEPTFGSDLSMKGVAVANAGSLDIQAATSYGEGEQLATIVRLAYGVVLAKDEPQVVILDDPLAHADAFRHGRMLHVIQDAAQRNLQIIIMTCHPERFDHLRDAVLFDLEEALKTV